MDHHTDAPSIAVIIPCYNEEKVIGKVVADFKRVLPGSPIFVIDNNCTDGTAAAARDAGARVIIEKRQGKGHAINCIPHKIKADYYVMVDGDDTYPADAVIGMLQIIKDEHADMVVGNRLCSYSCTHVRPFHDAGNHLVRHLVNMIFNADIKDPLSGYRVFTMEAALSLPFMVGGFDVETEMTVQALLRHLVIREVDIDYKDRPPGSISKLHTFKDGLLILVRIFMMTVIFKPFSFFGSIGLLLLLTGCLTGGLAVFNATENILLMAMLAPVFLILGITLFMTGVTIHIVNNRISETQKFLNRYIIAESSRSLS